MANEVKVVVIDNFHAHSDDDCSSARTFPTEEAAVAYCWQIVDSFLTDSFQLGMTSEALWDQYTMFGESPLVIDTHGDGFSGWNYARCRCAEICASQAGKE